MAGLSGAMIELGAAIALGKKTFIFRDDFRLNAPCEDYPLNLMLFTGMPADDWRDHYYTSVEELADPTKAFARWCVIVDSLDCKQLRLHACVVWVMLATYPRLLRRPHSRAAIS